MNSKFKKEGCCQAFRNNASGQQKSCYFASKLPRLMAVKFQKNKIKNGSEGVLMLASLAR